MFSCETTGRPRPNIAWWRENNSKQKSSVNPVVGKISITTTELGGERKRSSVLIIMNAQLSDEGLYVCVAVNAAGMKEENAVLTVHGK